MKALIQLTVVLVSLPLLVIAIGIKAAAAGADCFLDAMKGAMEIIERRMS